MSSLTSIVNSGLPMTAERESKQKIFIMSQNHVIKQSVNWLSRILTVTIRGEFLRADMREFNQIRGDAPHGFRQDVCAVIALQVF